MTLRLRGGKCAASVVRCGRPVLCETHRPSSHVFPPGHCFVPTNVVFVAYFLKL